MVKKFNNLRYWTRFRQNLAKALSRRIRLDKVVFSLKLKTTKKLDFWVTTRKHPSASMKPVSQWKSRISVDSINGLGAGIISGKAAF
jgi:hypothetical protein